MTTDQQILSAFADAQNEILVLREQKRQMLKALQVAKKFCADRGGSWADFEAAVNAAINNATA